MATKILQVTPIVEPMPEGAEKKYASRLGNLRRKGLNTAAPWRGGKKPANIIKDERRHANWNNVTGNDQSRNPSPTRGKPSS